MTTETTQLLITGLRGAICGHELHGDFCVALPGVLDEEGDTALLCPSCAFEEGMQVCPVCGHDSDIGKCVACYEREDNDRLEWSMHLNGYRF